MASTCIAYHGVNGNGICFIIEMRKYLVQIQFVIRGCRWCFVIYKLLISWKRATAKEKKNRNERRYKAVMDCSNKWWKRWRECLNLFRTEWWAREIERLRHFGNSIIIKSHQYLSYLSFWINSQTNFIITKKKYEYRIQQFIPTSDCGEREGEGEGEGITDQIEWCKQFL